MRKAFMAFMAFIAFIAFMGPMAFKSGAQAREAAEQGYASVGKTAVVIKAMQTNLKP